MAGAIVRRRSDLESQGFIPRSLLRGSSFEFVEQFFRSF
jgi:hypothetical protein